MKHALNFLIPLLVAGTFISMSLSLGVSWIFLGLAALIGLGGYMIVPKRSGPEGKLKIRRSLLNITLLVACSLISYKIWFNLAADADASSRDQLITVFLALGLSIAVFFYDYELNKSIKASDKKVLDRLLDGPSLLVCACAASVFCSLSLIGMKLLSKSQPEFLFLTVKFTERGIIPPVSLWLFYMGMAMYCVKFLILYIESSRIDDDLKELTSTPQPETTLAQKPESDESLDAPTVDNNSSIKGRPSKLVSFISLNLAQNRSEKASEVLFDEIWSKAKAFYMIPFWINWSIPTLGFIGTVLGISMASEGIAKILGSPEGLGRMAADLTLVIQPLGVAFDTTLIALSLSLLLVFVQTILQKWEERLLSKVENCFALLEDGQES